MNDRTQCSRLGESPNRARTSTPTTLGGYCHHQKMRTLASNVEQQELEAAVSQAVTMLLGEHARRAGGPHGESVIARGTPRGETAGARDGHAAAATTGEEGTGPSGATSDRASEGKDGQATPPARKIEMYVKRRSGTKGHPSHPPQKVALPDSAPAPTAAAAGRVHPETEIARSPYTELPHAPTVRLWANQPGGTR